MDSISNLYAQYFALTKDANAAATLVLAHVQSAESEASDSSKSLTVRDAARRLNCSPRVVYDLINKGELKCHRIGLGRGTIRVTPQNIHDYQDRDSRSGDNEMDPAFAAFVRG